MRISRGKLLAVDGLSLSEIVDKMDDNQLDEYCKALEAFTESFSAQETELRTLFEDKDYNSFFEALLKLRDVLIKIHADGLARSCPTLLSEVRHAENETTAAHLSGFLAAISALSIDIQMAMYSGASSNEADAKIEQTGAGDGAAELSILAVDDSSFILNILKSVLQNAGYKFNGVPSGEVALRFLMKNEPDLLLLDIEMPGMNGYELAKEIRTRGYKAPIIFLTGNSSKEYVIKAIGAGAADFIMKPFEKEHVLDKIKKVTGWRHNT